MVRYINTESSEFKVTDHFNSKFINYTSYIRIH
jgi:hypothetical protein